MTPPLKPHVVDSQLRSNRQAFRDPYSTGYVHTKISRFPMGSSPSNTFYEHLQDPVPWWHANIRHSTSVTLSHEDRNLQTSSLVTGIKTQRVKTTHQDATRVRLVLVNTARAAKLSNRSDLSLRHKSSLKGNYSPFQSLKGSDSMFFLILLLIYLQTTFFFLSANVIFISVGVGKNHSTYPPVSCMCL